MSLGTFFPVIPFPTCTIKDHNGFLSEEEYLCLVRDKRFSDWAELLVLRAFTHDYSERGESRNWKSWIDRNGNVISHFVDGHNENRRVVRWIKFTESNLSSLIIDPI